MSDDINKIIQKFRKLSEQHNIIIIPLLQLKTLHRAQEGSSNGHLYTPPNKIQMKNCTMDKTRIHIKVNKKK